MLQELHDIVKLLENMTACLGLISLLIELLDERAAPLLGPVAATVGRVSLFRWEAEVIAARYTR